MKSIIWGAVLAMALSAGQMMAQSLSASTVWHWEKGTIVIDVPQRPEGQQHALGLTVPKMEVVRVGFVGLGMRGPGAVERFTYIPGTISVRRAFLRLRSIRDRRVTRLFVKEMI